MEHSSLQKLISIVSFQMLLKPRAIKRADCIVVNILPNELCNFKYRDNLHHIGSQKDVCPQKIWQGKKSE